jgi:RimJ/RimL family protein N-acetyltransferase
LYRPAAEGDLVPMAADPTGSLTLELYRSRIEDRLYRPEWTWVAEGGGRVLARAVWWGFPESGRPLALDRLDAHGSVPVRDRAGLAAGLLAAAHRVLCDEPPALHLGVPVGWRDDPDARAAVGWRREAAAAAGLTDELERIRFTWTPDAGLPESGGRLTFVAEPDDEVFAAALRRVAEGSLDVTTRRDVEALGPERQAREDLNLYRDMQGEREWWRLAYTADGRLAGLAMPNRNPQGPVVGYLGVVPELRGRRYIDDVLAEITAFHASKGAARIIATTDVANAPMAAAFERAGYRATENRLVFSAPS